MLVIKRTKKIRGASIVEFALSSAVFLSIIFGMIYISLIVSSKILLIRAADYVSSEALREEGMKTNTHLGESMQTYQAAVSKVDTKGIGLLNASWLKKYVQKYKLEALRDEEPADKDYVIVLRPGEKVVDSTGASLQYSSLYPAAQFPDCQTITGKKYSDIMKTCPLHVEVRTKLRFWPFGEFVISGVSSRYLETSDAKQISEVGAPIGGWGNLTPRPTETSTPVINTPTPTPTSIGPSFTPTPTATFVPGNCAFGLDNYAQACSQCADPNPPNCGCTQHCYNSSNQFVGYNCQIPCDLG